ncbi:MAG: NTP transferase domain-containing protein [Alphaproteobacteria bacterium]|nr:NTP transferase domain-containing protein [Alphaproteobacteria bacterium]
MTYIILSAGRGVKLHPLTLNHPKSLYKLDGNITILQRLVRKIREFDKDAEIVVVVGYMHKQIVQELEDDNVKFVHNPFYSTTGSMGSLWFAQGFLQRENVTIINGDIVAGDKLMQDIVCLNTDCPYVLFDSTRKDANKYNVQIQNDLVCVMSKNLTSFVGNYASITKLDAVSSRFLLEQMNLMVNDEMYNLFFEDALVQMIFEKNFELYYKDIKDYAWTEVDCVDDLLNARKIQEESKQ